MLNFQEYSYLVESAFASWEYKPPTADPEKIMMDFYTFLNLDNESLITGKLEGAKISDEDYEKKEVERRTKSEMRLKLAENLIFVKDYNFDKIIEYLKMEFLKVLPFAVAAEFRHIFDDNISDSIQVFFKEKFGDIGLRFITQYAMTYHASTKGWKRQATENEANRKKEETSTYVTSYVGIKSGLKKTGLSWADFMKMANKCFTELIWSQSYGGTNWANIANAYSKLAKAEDRPSKAIWIDHVYDLEHNTGSVFTKVKRYKKNGTYEWIKKALDFKAKLEKPKDFNKLVDKASSDLQAFVWAYVFNQYDVTKEDITGLKANHSVFQKFYTNVKVGDSDSEGNIFDISSDGRIKFWRNQQGKYNKSDGPAIVYSDGGQYWYKNGKVHRLDGPAIVNYATDLTPKSWFIEDQRYETEAEFKKAVEEYKKTSIYKKGLADLQKQNTGTGKKSSDEEWAAFSKELYPKKDSTTSETPAKVFTNADYEKMSYDEIYSEYKSGAKDANGNQMFISGVSGNKSWYDNDGHRHKDIGPAVVSPDGKMIWYNHGKEHRLDGPAVIDPDAAKFIKYYIMGSGYSSEEKYWRAVKKLTGKGKPTTSETPEEPVSKPSNKNLTNADYEKMSFDEIYSEYKNFDKDENGNQFRLWIGSKIKDWTNVESGKLNKNIGPAVVYDNGRMVWIRNGLRHREDGPAYIDPSVINNEWWLDGVAYTEETYYEQLLKI